MEKLIKKVGIILAVFFACVAGVYASSMTRTVNAEDGHSEDGSETKEEKQELVDGMSISISPVSKILKMDEKSQYDDSFIVTNGSKETVKFETYAAPYSYNYNEDNDTYSLGFNLENTHTQITRWITFKDDSGNYVAKPHFTVESGQTKTIHYRISTPDSLPDGGQYAVLFAHTLSDTVDAGGIKTEASPGLIIYGRSSGETIVTSEIRNLSVNQTIKKDEVEEDAEGNRNMVTKEIGHINASAKVKNTGNIDFNAVGKLEVSGLFGGVIYETPSNRGRTSIIPDTELTVSDEWEETPAFGIFRVKWKVIAGDKEEEISTIIAINIAPLIIFIIIVLTILTIGFIMGAKKRKERRSRFAV